MVIEIILFVLFIVICFISYLFILSLRQINQYENFIIQVQQIVEYATEKMKVVDLSGHYESDDETGFFFKQLKELLKTKTLRDLADVRGANIGVSTTNESLPIIFDYWYNNYMNLEAGQLVKYIYFDDDDSAIGIITEVGKGKINILWTVEDKIHNISYRDLQHALDNGVYEVVE